jgi:hypothetical protein
MNHFGNLSILHLRMPLSLQNSCRNHRFLWDNKPIVRRRHLSQDMPKRLVILSQSGTTQQCRRMTAAAAAALRPRRVQRVRKGKWNLSQGGNPFGMKPIDYSSPPPVAPILIPPPPPGGIRALLSPALMLLFFASSLYLYFNVEDDITDYWIRVETGGLLIDDEDDEDKQEKEEEGEEEGSPGEKKSI